jgi:nucleoside-diphosphate-sugar epimerase
MKVLVTGASGFIGRHVTAYLASQVGFAVRAGSRSAVPGTEGVEFHRLDVLDLNALAPAMAGMDAVVHCAVGGRATTVTGTENVLRAAKRAGVQQVVHLSSVSVYGSASGEVSEATPIIASDGRGYAHWKAAAEAACRLANGPDLSVVMLRPAIVYGAGSELWIRTLARRMIDRRWGVFGAAGEGICNLVHVRDVATAVGAAMAARAGGDVFNINGPEPLTWNAWFAHFARAIGQPELPAISPAAWRRRSRAALPLKFVVKFMPRLRQRCENHLLGAPAASELALFGLRAHYPTDAARLRLDWRPVVGLSEGTEDAVHWLRQTGLVA